MFRFSIVVTSFLFVPVNCFALDQCLPFAGQVRTLSNSENRAVTATAKAATTYDRAVKVLLKHQSQPMRAALELHNAVEKAQVHYAAKDSIVEDLENDIV